MTVTNDRASTRKEAARQHLVIFRRSIEVQAGYFVGLGEKYGLTVDEIMAASGLSEASVERLLGGVVLDEG